MTINRRVLAAALLALCLSSAHEALAQSTVFVVRHAERADAGAKADPDPDLSAIGHARAEALAAVLKDAGITAIYVTHLKRTQQTAAPLARMLGLTPIVLAANETASLLERVKAQRGTALVVGHSNTVPEIVKGLGSGAGVTVADNEYDRLFVVVRSGSSTQVIPLRFR